MNKNKKFILKLNLRTPIRNGKMEKNIRPQMGELNISSGELHALPSPPPQKFIFNLNLTRPDHIITTTPRSKSPNVTRSKSPYKERSKSPIAVRRKSPIGERKNSPVVVRNKSPIAARSKSPIVVRRNGSDKAISKKFDYIMNCDPRRASIQNLNFDKFGIYKRYLEKMCDLLPVKKIDNIFGPILYFEYHIGDKKIGIFGEIHHLLTQTSDLDRYNPRRTVTFTSFIKSLLESSSVKNAVTSEAVGLRPTYGAAKEVTNGVPANGDKKAKVYDLYSEIFFINKDKPVRKGISDVNFSLFLMLQEFDKCFQINKSECEYSNLRGHYIDYRSKYSDLLNFDYIKGTKLYNFSQESTSTKPALQESIYRIKYINIYFNYFIQKDTKIQNSLKNNIFGNEIIEFITERQTKITNWALDYVKKDIWKPYKTQDELLSYISIGLRSLIMDIYTLGRLFKNQSNNQKNVIIYCGAAHAMTYKYFFDYIKISPFITIPSTTPLVNMVTFSPENKKSFLFNR